MYEQLELKRLEFQKEQEKANLKFRLLELAGHKAKDNETQLADAVKFAAFCFS